MPSYLPKVECNIENGFLFVECPFRESLAAAFNQLGGKWNAPKWVFDSREESRVKELLLKWFGHHGEPVPLCDIRVNLQAAWNDKFFRTAQMFLFGRLVAERKDRDSKPALGKGVIVHEGAFDSSGGSKQYPIIDDIRGIVLEIRDVPVSLVERWHSDDENCRVEIVRVADSHPLAAARAKVEAAAKTLEAALVELRAAAGDNAGNREACDDAIEYLTNDVARCYRDAY